MVLFSVELQKLTVENQEEKFRGSSTLCVVRQRGGTFVCTCILGLCVLNLKFNFSLC